MKQAQDALLHPPNASMIQAIFLFLDLGAQKKYVLERICRERASMLVRMGRRRKRRMAHDAIRARIHYNIIHLYYVYTYTRTWID